MFLTSGGRAGKARGLPFVRVGTAQVADAEQIITLTSAYTLTNATGVQQLFNPSKSGAVTVSTNTTYFFDCMFALTGLSGSSHNVGFGFGGTATITRQAWRADCVTAALGTASTDQTSFNTAASTALVTAGTTTTFHGHIYGKLVIGNGGTIIPQVNQVTASAAAVVSNDAYFRIWAVGPSTLQIVGAWS